MPAPPFEEPPLPCPFCGESRPFGYTTDGEDVSFYGIYAGPEDACSYRARCKTCSGAGPRVTIEEAAEAASTAGDDYDDWNDHGSVLAARRWNSRP